MSPPEDVPPPAYGVRDHAPGAGSGAGNGGRSRPSNVPWRGVDVLWAIVLTISAVLFVMATPLLVGATGDDGGTGLLTPLLLMLAALASAALVSRIAGVNLRLVGAVALVASLLWLGAQGLADNGEEAQRVLGIPFNVILLAILSSLFIATALTFSTSKYGASWRDLGFVSAGGISPYLLAIGAWLAAIFILGIWGIIVSALDIEALNPPESARDLLDIADGSLIVALLLVSVWVPVMEEVFFRGFALAGLRRRFGGVSALVISSAIFAAFHTSVGALVPTFVLGAALGWVYLKTGSLWPSIFVHGLQNAIATVLALPAVQEYIERMANQ